MDDFFLPEENILEPVPVKWNRDSLIGYTAGIIDGEGCVHIKKLHAGFTTYVEVGQSSSGFSVLVYLRENFDATLSSVFESKGNRKHRRLAFWTGDRAYSLLKIVAPLLLCKDQQAKLAMQFHERWQQEKAGRQGKQQLWTGDFLSDATRMYDEMKELNKKGRQPSIWDEVTGVNLRDET
jgi:hypothetical protein